MAALNVEDGWMLWPIPMLHGKRSPFAHKAVWLQRPEWPEPQKADPHLLHPTFNVAGVYWKPVEESA